MELDEFDKAEKRPRLPAPPVLLSLLSSSLYVMGVTALKGSEPGICGVKGYGKFAGRPDRCQCRCPHVLQWRICAPGLYYTFDSYLLQLKQFIKGLVGKQITTIHCIGHSLGGALAH